MIYIIIPAINADNTKQVVAKIHDRRRLMPQPPTARQQYRQTAGPASGHFGTHRRKNAFIIAAADDSTF